MIDKKIEKKKNPNYKYVTYIIQYNSVFVCKYFYKS